MGLNVFTFSGNLGNDCRKGNAGGTAVVNFSVPCKSGYGQNEQTVWVECALWGKRAEGKMPEYLLKGRKVTVSGELGTREHDGKTYITCRVSSLDLGSDGGSGDSGNHQPQTQRQPVSGTNAQQPNPQAQGGGDFDDDIPFAPIGKQYRSLLNCM